MRNPLMQSETLSMNSKLPSKKINYKHDVAQKLHAIMQKKQTNLAIAADVRTKKELFNLIDNVGNEICILKTHIDIIDDFDQDLIVQLKQKAKEYNFLICEDRKFADIGSTVQAQYTGGVYHIADWADIIIAHAIAGPTIIKALSDCKKDCAILLLAELSCADNLIDATYTHKVLEWAKKHDDSIIGIIAQNAQLDHPHQFKCTPGVNLQQASDNLGQQYRTPEHVVGKKMTDIIIVGRGIYKAENQKCAAQAYRKAGWDALESR